MSNLILKNSTIQQDLNNSKDPEKRTKSIQIFKNRTIQQDLIYSKDPDPPMLTTFIEYCNITVTTIPKSTFQLFSIKSENGVLTQVLHFQLINVNYSTYAGKEVAVQTSSLVPSTFQPLIKQKS
ncbi:uncharacterized protein [Drosophila kikkawai]|uniref:Uncharacterized protein n=1 Tax=Drosophila kikkawai TaxID=30033 RepID=A0ABM4GIB6_DROKI